jgi:hypothetical protein
MAGMTGAAAEAARKTPANALDVILRIATFLVTFACYPLPKERKAEAQIGQDMIVPFCGAHAKPRHALAFRLERRPTEA